MYIEKGRPGHKTSKNLSPFGMEFYITLPWMAHIDLRVQKEKNIEVTVKHKIENELASSGIEWRIS